MDYVFEVLGKQGWERCDSLNDYFAGWEHTPDESDDDKWLIVASSRPETAETACQTPDEWAVISKAQERKEEERGRAEPRNRTLQPDQAVEKKPKAEAICLAEPGETHAGMKEVVFWSLLLCVSYHGRVKELESWARAVILEEPNISDTWTPSAEKWPKDRTFQASSIYTPLTHAHTRVAWTEGALDAVGLAMQGWRGEGYINGLTGRLLKHYIAKPPLGPRIESKTKPPPRYRSQAVVRVARLLHDHGAKLRRLLNITTDSDDAKPIHVVLAEVQAQNAMLKQHLSEEQAGARRLQDAWRKAAGRLKKKSTAVTKARREERTKATAQKQQEVKEVKADAKRKIREHEDSVRGELEAEYTDTIRSLRVKAKKAEKAEEKATALSGSRFKRLREAEDKLSETQQQLDEFFEQAEEMEAESQAKDAADAFAKIQSMPTWRPHRASGRGGGRTFGVPYRRAIYSQFANGTPKSAVGKNIVSVVKVTAPWLDPVPPSLAMVSNARFEQRTIEEACAAREAADAYRIRVLGSDETTKYGNAGITSNVVVEPTPGAELKVVVLRGAYCSSGGTADAIANAIETKCFMRGRDLLQRWEAKCRCLYPNHKWSGPAPQQLSLARLADGGALQGDTCNTAQLTKSIIAEMVAAQKRSEMGAEAWDALTQEEQVHVTRVHKLDCFNHMRNIFLGPMSKAMSKLVAEELKDQLDAFSSWDRMTTDFDQLLRGSYKEFHHGNKYYKGKGREFWVWLKETYPLVFVMHLERAEGGRQDLDFDAAVPMYIIRRYMVEFLHLHVFGADHSNILEDFLYLTLSATEYVAMMRTNAVVDLLISRPLRFLSGSAYKLNNFSPLSLGSVGKKGALDLTEEIMTKASTNGAVLLDPSLDIFSSIREQQPLFREWHDHMFTKAHCLGPDGKTEHLHWKLARDEVLSPEDPTNACQAVREKTIKYLETQCIAGLEAMRDKKRAIAKHLASQEGDQAYNKNAQAHTDCAGLDATNDRLAESIFGIYDSILRRFPGISMEAASALTQAIHAKRWAPGGYIDSLPPPELHALFEMARTTVQEMRAIDHSHHAALDAYHTKRRKTNAENEVAALVKQYALALSFFDRWESQGVASPTAMRTALDSISSNQLKLDYLREQIEMRVIGLGFDEFKTKWSSSKDEELGSIADLSEHLKEILLEEAERRQEGTLPDAAVVPVMRRKTLKELGTPTPQALELAGQVKELPHDELLRRAEEERRRLEAVGELDRTADVMPQKSPPCDKSLIGKELEIRWRYWRPTKEGERGKKKAVDIWCVGTVIQVANNATDKQSLPVAPRSSTALTPS